MQEGKIGVRWRTEKEVVSGKGQFICGAKGCEERRGLASFEVPLVYMEAGAQKRALVKVRGSFLDVRLLLVYMEAGTAEAGISRGVGSFFHNSNVGHHKSNVDDYCDYTFPVR